MYWGGFIYGFTYPALIFLVLLAICIIVSMAIEFIKKPLQFNVIQLKIDGIQMKDRFFIESGDYQRTIKNYKKAIEINPNYANAYYNRGNAYYKLGDFCSAIKDFDKVIELAPQDADAYSIRGLAYAKLGDYQMAIKDCDEAIKINPNNASVYYDKACLFSIMGNELQACDYLHQAIEKGYKDWKNIKSDSDLNNIRTSTGYREIMSGK